MVAKWVNPTGAAGIWGAHSAQACSYQAGITQGVFLVQKRCQGGYYNRGICSSSRSCWGCSWSLRIPAAAPGPACCIPQAQPGAGPTRSPLSRAGCPENCLFLPKNQAWCGIQKRITERTAMPSPPRSRSPERENPSRGAGWLSKPPCCFCQKPSLKIDGLAEK